MPTTESDTTPTPEGQPDAWFLEAEAELVALHERYLAAEAGELFRQLLELEDRIGAAPAASPLGAAVKLRRLLDTGLGMPADDAPYHRLAVIRAAYDDLARLAGAALPASPRPLWRPSEESGPRLPDTTMPDAATDDPHAGWLAEWERLLHYCNNDAPAEPSLAALPHRHRMAELERQLVETPARTVAGVREQLRFACRWLDDFDAIEDKGDAALERLTAAPVEPDPHPAWLAEMDTLHARDGINTGRTDEEIDAEVERLAELREWLSTTPAATFAGAVAQIRYVREDMGRFGSHDYHLDALDLALATLTQGRA